MLVIFAFSSQKKDDSQALSLSLANPVESLIELHSSETFEDDAAREKHFEKLTKKLNRIARRDAHIVLYFLLGLFMYLYMISKGKDNYSAVIYTLFFSMMYGIFDELHQLLIEDRVAELQDVCADVFGAAVAVMIVFAINSIRERRKQK